MEPLFGVLSPAFQSAGFGTCITWSEDALRDKCEATFGKSVADQLQMYHLTPVTEDHPFSEQMACVLPDSRLTLDFVESAISTNIQLTQKVDRSADALAALAKQVEADQEHIRQLEQQLQDLRASSAAHATATAPTSKAVPSAMGGVSGAVGEELEILRLQLVRSDRLREQSQRTVDALKLEFELLTQEILSDSLDLTDSAASPTKYDTNYMTEEAPKPKVPGIKMPALKLGGLGN